MNDSHQLTRLLLSLLLLGSFIIKFPRRDRNAVGSWKHLHGRRRAGTLRSVWQAVSWHVWSSWTRFREDWLYSFWRTAARLISAAAVKPLPHSNEVLSSNLPGDKQTVCWHLNVNLFPDSLSLHFHAFCKCSYWKAELHSTVKLRVTDMMMRHSKHIWSRSVDKQGRWMSAFLAWSLSTGSGPVMSVGFGFVWGVEKWNEANTEMHFL